MKENAARSNLVKPDYSDYNLDAEKASLRSFLNENEMWIPEGFYSSVRIGDVIDLYTCPPEMKQLYGNSEFKKLCSYTENQMKDNPFPKLFWRSDEVQLQIIKTATEVAFHSDTEVPWNIDNHELIESLHPRKRTFEIDLGYLSPCFEVGTNQRVAFVSSLCVRFIFEWPDFKES